MTKTRQEKIDNISEKIAQLENQRKQELQKQKADDRKARTKRLCTRHGLLEKYMPELVTFTDEQFEVFIKTGINTSYGKKKLGEIIAQGEKIITPTSAERKQTTAIGSAPTPPTGQGAEG